MINKGLLYDTFNAKYLTYQEVAASFIPNDEFQQLITNNHTLLMGPRGCGKTTLLKMLNPTALSFWDDERKNEIPFIAIYIPTDIQWKSSLSYLEKHLKDKVINERISEFLIITNVQIQLCRTFESLIRLKFNEKKQRLILEDQISNELVNIWDLGKQTDSTFNGIELSLLKRIDVVNQHINKYIFFRKYDDLTSELPGYIFLELLPTITRAITVFEKGISLLDTQRWALCFDEFEIAPKFFQLKIYSYLRSTSQKLLFKITTTPIVVLENNIVEASQDNDFKAVRLWVYNDTGSAKWESFCEKLISKRIERALSKDIKSTTDIFGNYDINQIIGEELNVSSKYIQGAFHGSLDNLLFKALSKIDISFQEFLISKRLDPKNPVAKSFLDNKSIFQKHKLNVLYRLIYKYRTRKRPTINYGVPYIYDICDGNPRSVIGLVDEMLLTLEKGNDNSHSVSFPKQSEIIFRMSKRFFNLIKNHPDSTLIVRNKPFNLANDILRKIGANIHNRIVKEKFTPTVATTFTVDAEIDQKILKLLEQALYLGAIIYLDPIESLSMNGMINKRFRLSYLLTPLFRIPNRVDGQINMATILREESVNEDQSSFEF